MNYPDTLKVYIGTNGNEHRIIQGRDGVVYCDCMAWKMSKDTPKSCKHLIRFKQESASAKTRTLSPKKPKHEDSGLPSKLKDFIAEEAARLRGEFA